MESWARLPLIHFVENQCMAPYQIQNEELKRTTREVGVRNMLIETRLLLFLKKLQEKDISIIVMKGCHLIHDIYPFGIRPIDDIDILIDRKDFESVRKVIESLGYQDDAYGMDLWTHIEVSNKITFINQDTIEIPFDVHFTLGPYPYLGRIPYETLLEHSEKKVNQGIQFLVLKPELLLIHLCLHLFQHHYTHWQVSALDICALTNQECQRFNWNDFLALIKRYDLQLPIQYSLKRAALFGDVLIPAYVVGELESIPISKKEKLIFKSCLKMTNGLEKHVLQFFTLPGSKKKLKCLLRIGFPNKSFLSHYFKGSYRKYLLKVIYTTFQALLRLW